MFTLTQVYAGAAVGMHRPSRNADDVKCKKELSWDNKLCTEVGSKLRNFLRREIARHTMGTPDYKVDAFRDGLLDTYWEMAGYMGAQFLEQG